MAFMILGLAAAIAFIGYKYYEKNYNIEVPNLIGLTYEEAEVKLAKKDLNIKKKETKIVIQKTIFAGTSNPNNLDMFSYNLIIVFFNCKFNHFPEIAASLVNNFF